MKRTTVVLREDQVEKLNKAFPATLHVKQEGIRSAIDLFLAALDEYGDEVMTDVMFKRGGYKIQPVQKGGQKKKS
jgi:hypothetical protein